MKRRYGARPSPPMGAAAPDPYDDVAGMPGMKADCGGAAACLAAFEAAVEIGVGKQAVHLILCLAENAIGPR